MVENVEHIAVFCDLGPNVNNCRSPGQGASAVAKSGNDSSPEFICLLRMWPSY